MFFADDNDAGGRKPKRCEYSTVVRGNNIPSRTLCQTMSDRNFYEHYSRRHIYITRVVVFLHSCTYSGINSTVLYTLYFYMAICFIYVVLKANLFILRVVRS